MKATLLLILVLPLVRVSVRGQQLAPNAPKDQPVLKADDEVSAFEKAIAPYIQEAKKTYPEAKKRFLLGLPTKQQFFVTTRIKDPDGTFEQVFVFVTKLNVENKQLEGRIANPLGVVRTFKWGQAISFAESEVLDWTISKPDSTEEGNYIGKYLDEVQKNKSARANDPRPLQEKIAGNYIAVDDPPEKRSSMVLTAKGQAEIRWTRLGPPIYVNGSRTGDSSGANGSWHLEDGHVIFSVTKYNNFGEPLPDWMQDQMEKSLHFSVEESSGVLFLIWDKLDRLPSNGRSAKRFKMQSQ